MQTDATTVEEYIAGLSPERRDTVRAVRDVVAEAMPEGYRESVAWGMITWSVPLERYPETYNGQPLGYVALAAQKNHYSLYLMGLYSDGDEDKAFRERWRATGRPLDMGKSCLRFRTLEDLDIPLVADVVASTPVDDFLATYERVRDR
ncbi:MAG: iron chaperone [Actinomycetes bacterium]